MNSNPKILQRSINQEYSLIQSLKIMDSTGFRSLLVVNSEGLFEGILSIGDIQRAIIANMPLDVVVSKVMRKNPRIAHSDTPIEYIKQEMLQFRMEFIPVVDESNRIINIHFWDELFIAQKLPPQKLFDLPVVIMAGGEGTRLKPLTNVIPKPLLPIGETTILEEIFNRFKEHGCNHFYISINYKADLIKYYIESLGLPFKLTFFKENKPLGTAGSLQLLINQINNTFFVTNCDILIEQDYSEILDYHKSNNNDITLVAVLKTYGIPYGTVDTGDNGELRELLEKPDITLKINSGMYILEPKILQEIPEDQFFHITHLIKKIRSRGGRIGVFPVSEKSWRDIGDWNVYLDNIAFKGQSGIH